MPRARRWSDLIPGVLAIVAAIVGVAGVLAFARVGTVRGAKFRVYATVAEARGLSPGSEVWVAGERVGTVDGIDFLDTSADTTQRLLLTLSVLERARPVIRRHAAVSVHPGGSLVGAPVVSLALGSPQEPMVRPGDTLRAPRMTSLDQTKLELSSATQEAPLVIANVRLLGAQLRAARGTLGAFGIEGRSTLATTGRAAGRFMATMRGGRGTVPRLLGGGGARSYARRALARVDSIRALVGGTSGTTSIGRFRRDSTLLRTIAEVQADLDTVATVLAEPRGAAGRLQHDQALADEVQRARAELAAIVADIKRNPLRYLPF